MGFSLPLCDVKSLRLESGKKNQGLLNGGVFKRGGRIGILTFLVRSPDVGVGRRGSSRFAPISSDLFRFALLVLGNAPICSDLLDLFSEFVIRTNQETLSADPFCKSPNWCVCVCVCACARGCVCVCVCVCARTNGGTGLVRWMGCSADPCGLCTCGVPMASVTGIAAICVILTSGRLLGNEKSARSFSDRSFFMDVRVGCPFRNACFSRIWRA